MDSIANPDIVIAVVVLTEFVGEMEVLADVLPPACREPFVFQPCLGIQGRRLAQVVERGNQAILFLNNGFFSEGNMPSQSGLIECVYLFPDDIVDNNIQASEWK